MRYIAALLAAITLFTTSARAEEWNLSGTFTTSTWTEYLFGSNGAIGSDDPVQQSDLTIYFPHGFYTNVWWSTGIDTDFSDGFDDEIDWTIGKTGTFVGLDYDAGIAYFDLVNLFSTSGDVGDFIQPYVQISRSFEIANRHVMTPFIRDEYLFATNGEKTNGGNYLHIGVNYTWQATSYLSVSPGARVIHDDGAGGSESAVLGRFDLSLDWRVIETVIVSFPKVKIMTPLTHVEDGRTTDAAFGATLTITF